MHSNGLSVYNVLQDGKGIMICTRKGGEMYCDRKQNMGRNDDGAMYINKLGELSEQKKMEASV